MRLLVLEKVASTQRIAVSSYNKAASAQKLADQRTLLEIAPALKAEEFFLVFQPKVDMITKNVCGFEALIRWKKPMVQWLLQMNL
jgi:sensor c-di-GMP phosphodiesterase-like protein